jgi:hypothetical protein
MRRASAGPLLGAALAVAITAPCAAQTAQAPAASAAPPPAPAPAPAASAASAAAAPSPANAPGAADGRIEARSGNFVVVGLVRGEHMVLHVSRVTDNAPVHDAAVSVVLRGTSYPATATPEGAYVVTTHDLAIPGPAAVLIVVSEGSERDQLSGTLDIGATSGPREEHDGSRQIAWWVLNFAVCIGFLMLWNRRRRKAES